MITVLLGPPGSGKGTQAKVLKEEKHFLHLSTGDMLRAAIQQGSPLGLKVKDIMARGELVSDDIVLALIKEKLETSGAKTNVVLDGFPRNLAQAKSLDDLLRSSSMIVDKVVSIEIDPRELIERLTGRRTCPTCGAGFHVKFQPPKKDGICDSCGGSLVQRKDDTETVIVDRLKVFEQQTSPLREYYQNKGLLAVVDGSQKPVAVTKEIFKAFGI